MIKKTVTYTDFNGVERTESFYFGLTESELLDMEVEADGGITDYYQRIVDAKDSKAIVREVKNLLIRSYGEKDSDGKYFMKTPEIAKRFECSAAFVALYKELATDANAAAAFCNGIMPSTLHADAEAVKKAVDKAQNGDQAHEE